MAPVPCSASTCTDTTDASLKISCDTCKLLFHCNCVSVREELSVVLSRASGFFWRCPSCNNNDVNSVRFEKILTFMESMTKYSFVPPKMASDSTIVPENPAITTDNDAMEIGESLVRDPVVPRAKRSRSMTPSILLTVKSRRLDFNTVDPDEVPVLPAQTAAATDIIDDIANVAPKVDLKACVMPKYDKFLYISQFKPDTNAEKIRNFVVEKLKCNPNSISCQKLISSKRDPSLPLSFISFKIGTTKKLAKKILKNDFWPAGLVAKEFEDRSKNANPPRQAANQILKSQQNRKHPDDGHLVRAQANGNRRTHSQHNNQGGRQLNFQPLQGHRQRHQNSSAMTWRVSQKKN